MSHRVLLSTNQHLSLAVERRQLAACTRDFVYMYLNCTELCVRLRPASIYFGHLLTRASSSSVFIGLVVVCGIVV